MIGYIKLYRQLFENPDYFAEKFSRIQAWIDLLLLANYEESAMYVRGIKMQVGRGQLAKSMDSLAERWRWSRFKVEEYLKELENQQQINVQKNNVISLITITNYERYQGLETENSDENQQQINVQIDGQIKEKVSPHNIYNPPLKEKREEEKEEEKSQDKSCEQKKKSSQKKTDKRPPTTNPIEVRKEWLKNEIRRVNAKGKYDPDMCNAFYLYWSELSNDGKLMRYERQGSWETSKRLALWYYNEAKRWSK